MLTNHLPSPEMSQFIPQKSSTRSIKSMLAANLQLPDFSAIEDSTNITPQKRSLDLEEQTRKETMLTQSEKEKLVNKFCPQDTQTPTNANETINKSKNNSIIGLLEEEMKEKEEQKKCKMAENKHATNTNKQVQKLLKFLF